MDIVTRAVLLRLLWIVVSGVLPSPSAPRLSSTMAITLAAHVVWPYLPVYHATAIYFSHHEITTGVTEPPCMSRAGQGSGRSAAEKFASEASFSAVVTLDNAAK